MTTKQLKDLLTDIADEAAPAALHQRAVTQSRRDGRYRVMLASITALVLAGAGIFGVSALAERPGDQDRGADPAQPTAGVDELSGTYYQVTGGDTEPEALVAWEVGAEEPNLRFDAQEDWGRYYGTGRVSPDGRYFSYLTQSSNDGDDDGSGDTNLIKIRDVTTGKSTRVGEYDEADGGPCSAPAWSPDGERLLIDQGAEFGKARTGFVDIGSGDFNPFPVDDPCDALVTTDADGEDTVLSTATDSEDRVEVYATGADAEQSAIGAADVVEKEGAYIVDLVAASPEGRYLCVATAEEPGNHDAGLGGGTPYCDLMIDTEDATAFHLPEYNGIAVTGSTSTFAVPGRLVLEGDDGTGDGVHLLYDYEAELLDEAGSTLGSDSLPIAYVPD